MSASLDWDKIIETATRQEVLPLLCHGLGKPEFHDLIPQNTFDKLHRYYYILITHNLKIEQEICLILEAVSHEKIGFIPFKGFNLIYTLYHNPGLRTMDDVDVLTKESQFDTLKEILRGLGYENTVVALDFKNQHAVFSRKLADGSAVYLDVHHSFVPARPYPVNLPVWERTVEIPVNNKRMLSLSDEDTFLVFVLTLRRDTRKLKLKLIADIAEFIKAKKDALDWGYIIKSSEDSRLNNSIYLALYLAQELLKTDVPAGIMAKCRPHLIQRALIRLTINKHNFFSFTKWQGTLLRGLIFDRPVDILVYVWRVSFLERFAAKIFRKETKARNTTRPADETINK